MLQQLAARGCQLYPGAIAIEKLDLEMLLQFVNVLGDGRLADEQLFGRLCKVQPPRYCMKYLELE
jgi:hypothetical protein